MPYEVSLGSGEPLVKDARLEKIFYQLQQFRQYPDGTAFVTILQEPNDKEPRRLAVFMVISDHPLKTGREVTPKHLITTAAMPYERWQEMEKQHRHYASLTDPVRPIFAGLLRRHLAHYAQLKENRDTAIKRKAS